MGGSIPITARSLESIIRMAEAFARMHLRDIVIQSDVDRAMSIVIRSFIGAQKYSVKKSLSKVTMTRAITIWISLGLRLVSHYIFLKLQAFSKYISYDQDHEELANHVLSQFVKEMTNYYYYRNQEMPDILELDADEFAIRVSL